MNKSTHKLLAQVIKDPYLCSFAILGFCATLLSGAVLARFPEWQRAWAAPISPQPIGITTTIEVPVEVIRPINCTTEKCRIMSYILEKFGDDASDAITILNQCENNKLDPHARNFNIQENGRRSWDIGVFQINVDEGNAEEIERLKDWEYNIDRAYDKFVRGDGGKHKNSFYAWTCGYIVKDYTYLDAIRGKKQ